MCEILDKTLVLGLELRATGFGLTDLVVEILVGIDKFLNKALILHLEMVALFGGFGDLYLVNARSWLLCARFLTRP